AGRAGQGVVGHGGGEKRQRTTRIDAAARRPTDVAAARLRHRVVLDLAVVEDQGTRRAEHARAVAIAAHAVEVAAGDLDVEQRDLLAARVVELEHAVPDAPAAVDREAVPVDHEVAADVAAPEGGPRGTATRHPASRDVAGD